MAEAIEFIIKGDVGQYSVKPARHAVATGTRIGGLFADCGIGLPGWMDRVGAMKMNRI